eukprot:262311_1
MALKPTSFENEESLKKLQDYYKQNITKLFGEFINSAKFKFIVNQLELNDIEFKIADTSQSQEIINLIQNSFKLRNPIDILFDVARITKDVKAIKEWISMNRCIIGIDKITKQIVTTIMFPDMFDNFEPWQQEVNVNDYNMPQSHKHLLELTDKQNSWKNVITNSLTNFDFYEKKYGKYIHGEMMTAKSSHQGRFIVFLMAAVFSAFFTEICGYKVVIATSSNKKTINTAKKSNDNIITELNYSKYIFKDGTNIETYFNKLAKRKPQIDIEKFKKESCWIAVIVTKPTPIEAYMKMAQMIRSNKNKSKL